MSTVPLKGTVTLEHIIRMVYPADLANRILVGMTKLRILTINQSSNNDLIGEHIHMEEELFSEDLGI